MQTEIIKFDSLKSNFMHLLENLSSKFQQKKDYDITIIAKENQQLPLVQIQSLVYSNKENLQKKSKATVVLFEENNQIFNSNSIESNISLENRIQSRQKSKTELHIIDNKVKSILKNIKYSQNNSIFKNKLTNKSISLQKSVQTSQLDLNGQKSLDGQKIQYSKESKQVCSLFVDIPSEIKTQSSKQMSELEIHITQNDQTAKKPAQSKTSKCLHTQLQINDEDIQSDQFSIKVNQISYLTDKSYQKQQELNESDEDETGFLIQNYLNDALAYIQPNDPDGLQDFLYKFKEKYSFSTVKIQIKWSLLMAYCKELKLQFQRASINYSNSIKLIEIHNCNINIEMADIYSHLGRCDYENSEWNKAISSYGKALNIYKAKKKAEQYSKCIINLGILYLDIQYLQQAQKCFLTAYNINRSEEMRENNKNSNLKLINLLFNLLQCNIKIKNYIQSQQILHLINKMLEQTGNNHEKNLHLIKYYIKGGKLYYILRLFNKAENNYKKALALLKNNNEIHEYLQIYELYGLLKENQKNWSNSLIYYESALIEIQKFIPKDNLKVNNIKKRIEYCFSMVDQESLKKKKKGNYKVEVQPFEKILPSNSLGIDEYELKYNKKDAIVDSQRQKLHKKISSIIWIEDQRD